MQKPHPTQPTLRKLPPSVLPARCASVHTGKNAPPSTSTRPPPSIVSL